MLHRAPWLPILRGGISTIGGFNSGMRALLSAVIIMLLASKAILDQLGKRSSGPPKKRDRILIIGASGAIGKELVATVSAVHGRGSVIAALRKTPLPIGLESETGVISEFGIDLRNASSIEVLLSKYGKEIFAIWNLAAPLSVESERDPSLAEDVTVGGMRRLIKAMDQAKMPHETRLLFSDSIGSFGATAPRRDANAAWLIAHPTADPGSAYGEQKRKCRELLKTSRYDTRFAVIPGVLHDAPVWGAGTTEYALDAILHWFQHHNSPPPKTGNHGSSAFVCPVGPNSTLPMVHSADLMQALLALQDAPRSSLSQPDAGYTIGGFSFTPSDLVSYLTSKNSNAVGARIENDDEGEESASEVASEMPAAWTVKYQMDGAASIFAELWPDSLSRAEMATDLGWEPVLVPTMEAAVDRIIAAHQKRASASLL